MILHMHSKFSVRFRQDYAVHNRGMVVCSPLVNIHLRRTLSVTPLRNFPVNKRHKKLFAPQTSDLCEILALIFLYNFHREQSLLKLKMKKLSPKIKVKNIKNRVYPIRRILKSLGLFENLAFVSMSTRENIRLIARASLTLAN